LGYWLKVFIFVGDFYLYNLMGQEALIEKLMDSKAQVGVIAEKAWRNFEKHEKNLHYFMLGHAFKQIDTKVFNLQTRKDSYAKEATAYKTLQKTWLDDKFLKKDSPTENLKEVCLGKYLDSIRNFNAHYIHDFSQMDVSDLKDFLFEAFKLAVLQVYVHAKLPKKISVEEASKDEKVVPEFLLDMFLPWNNKKYKEQYFTDNKNNNGSDAYKKAKQYVQLRAEFKKKTLDEALRAILFIQLEKSLYVGVQKNEQISSEEKKEHCFFEIAKDKTYLSLHGVLFFLSLFLYKDEAQKLISKIRGYKLNNTQKFQQKRNIFSFFAKKFSSEDIDSQEANLIKFRDIIQYLNKYPLAWNQIIDNKDKDEVKEHLQNFQKRLCIDYAKQKSYQLPSSITDNPSGYTLSKIIAQIYVTGKDEKEQKSKEEKLNKDKERIKNGFLYTVYARNQDRFILFATRFLAERGYFGDDAQFKMYQFQAMYEQNAYVDNKTKKEKDKLKYHDGRIVTFRSWKEQMEHFPSWDMPFVVQNNAIQVQISYNQDPKPRTVSIQRELLGFLLRHALENGAGKDLFSPYFQQYDKDLESVTKSPALLNLLDLEKHAVLTEEQKNCKKEYKKILPKRLFPKAQSEQEPITALAKLVQSAKAYKEWHEKRKKRAQEEQDMHFEKRNQGRRFKWMFVFKAWNMLYFKTAYKNNKAKADAQHHKSFHITRDEFQELSRAMYNWTEQGDAAHLYIKNLFDSKNFFQQTAFTGLFDDLKNLEDAFKKTLEACEKQQQISVRKEKYQLHDYKFIKNRQAHIYYINLSYFLNEKVCGKFFPKKTITSSCLVDYYYPQIKMGKKNNHTLHRNFVEKLRLNYQEDTLLYQLALQYHNLDIIDKKDKPLRTILQEAVTRPVRTILQEEVRIPVTDKDEKKELYKITAPFKQITNLVAWLYFSKNQLAEKKTSYLSNIPTYLKACQTHPKLKNTLKEILKDWEDKTLSYDSIRKIDAHVLDTLHKTMAYILHLERYCAVKKIVIEKDKMVMKENRIGWDTYKDDMQKYGIVKRMRDKSAHFGLPYHIHDNKNEFFIDLLEKWEENFLANEIKNYLQWNDVPKEKRIILTFFLEKLHNDYFKRGIKDKDEQRKEAQKEYFKKHILQK
jgi:hypothetical protein